MFGCHSRSSFDDEKWGKEETVICADCGEKDVIRPDWLTLTTQFHVVNGKIYAWLPSLWFTRSDTPDPEISQPEMQYVCTACALKAAFRAAHMK